MALTPVCSMRGPTWPTSARLPADVRRIATTSASSSRPRMHPKCVISGRSPANWWRMRNGISAPRLDWVAVDHWNTDNPHVHILIRGRADDGRDLVISRDYISRGFRARAEERVTLELGPRSDLEIRSALEKEVEAERWTGLDRALRNAADDRAGIANLRPHTSESDPELRRLMVGRAAKLERLGFAEQIEPGCWTLKPGLEDTLRDLSIRGDIIKTMHRAMSGGWPRSGCLAGLLFTVMIATGSRARPAGKAWPA